MLGQYSLRFQTRPPDQITIFPQNIKTLKQKGLKMQSQTAILSFKGLPLQLSVRASRLSENGSFLQISLQGQRTADHQARGGGGPSSQSRLKNLEYFNQFTPQCKIQV